jgi:hypothetical protein
LWKKEESAALIQIHQKCQTLTNGLGKPIHSSAGIFVLSKWSQLRINEVMQKKEVRAF